MEVNKEKIRYILQFFFDKGENPGQAAESVNGVYGADTVTANYEQFWFRQFRSGIFKWDWKGIIYYELLPYDQTLNLDIYCQQLDRLKLVTDQKRPDSANRRGVVFHQDNARPYTSVATRQKLWELDWKVLMNTPYSPELTPNDYLLFLVLKNFLSDKNWDQKKIVKIDY
ncbi:mariner Mos1 transposase [Trichonephila clavipes]|nr:mariner Mos1 transposase [Trichonephila clavipes]